MNEDLCFLPWVCVGGWRAFSSLLDVFSCQFLKWRPGSDYVGLGGFLAASSERSRARELSQIRRPSPHRCVRRRSRCQGLSCTPWRSSASRTGLTSASIPKTLLIHTSHPPTSGNALPPQAALDLAIEAAQAPLPPRKTSARRRQLSASPRYPPSCGCDSWDAPRLPRGSLGRESRLLGMAGVWGDV